MRRRGLIGPACGLLIACVPGCSFLFGTQSDGFESPPVIDYSEMNLYAQIAIGLTDITSGKRTQSSVRSEFSSYYRQFDFCRAAELDFDYLLFVDEVGRQVVVVPGTASPQQIEFDRATELVYDEELGIRLHAGFRAATLMIRDDLVPRLTRGAPLRLVGFSFGGAVAALLAPYLDRDGHAIDEVITFGAPKVTDAEGAATLEWTPVLRMQAADDPVPSLPRIPEYAHFGPLLILLDGPYICYLQPDDPLYASANQIPGPFPDLALFDHVTYPGRTASKIGVVIVQVPFERHGRYIDRDMPAASQPVDAPE